MVKWQRQLDYVSNVGLVASVHCGRDQTFDSVDMTSDSLDMKLTKTLTAFGLMWWSDCDVMSKPWGNEQTFDMSRPSIFWWTKWLMLIYSSRAPSILWWWYTMMHTICSVTKRPFWSMPEDVKRSQVWSHLQQQWSSALVDNETAQQMNQQTVDFSSANAQHKDIDTLFTSGMYDNLWNGNFRCMSVLTVHRRLDSLPWKVYAWMWDTWLWKSKGGICIFSL